MDREQERLEAAFNKAVDDLAHAVDGDPAVIVLTARLHVARKRLNDYLARQDES